MKSTSELQAELMWHWEHFVDANQFNLSSQVESYMQAKKQSYTGNEYIANIEKNAIYLSERTGVVISAIGKHYYSGLPRFRLRKRSDYIDLLSISPAQETTAKVISFVRGVATDPGSCWSYLDYYQLRVLRKKSKGEYVQEIEYMCRWSQGQLVMCNVLLNILLQIPKSRRSYKHLEAALIHPAIVNQTRAMTSIELGTASFVGNPKPNEK